MKKSLLFRRSGLMALAAVALVAASTAFAQSASNSPQPPSCYPTELGGVGTNFAMHTLDTGYVACWVCPSGTRPILAGDVNTVLRNVGDRIDTLKKTAAATPAAAASAAAASWKRHVTKNVMTDPAFGRMREELAFRQICGFRPASAASAPG